MGDGSPKENTCSADEGLRSTRSSLPVRIDCRTEKMRFCVEEVRTLEMDVGRREESIVGAIRERIEIVLRGDVDRKTV